MTSTSIFSSLITSKTCIRILMRLFFNPKQNVYLRELADEFGMSTSMAREEQQLSKAGLYSQAKKTAKKSTIRLTSSTPFYRTPINGPQSLWHGPDTGKHH